MIQAQLREENAEVFYIKMSETKYLFMVSKPPL